MKLEEAQALREQILSAEGPLLTPEMWLEIKHPNLLVMDPDGWRGTNSRPWTDPISEEEFGHRLSYCTISGTF